MVLPAAVSGLVAAFILAVSRAIGETMVVLLAAGSANAAQFTTNPFEGGLTMTAAIASQIRGTDRPAVSDLVSTASTSSASCCSSSPSSSTSSPTASCAGSGRRY